MQFLSGSSSTGTGLIFSFGKSRGQKAISAIHFHRPYLSSTKKNEEKLLFLTANPPPPINFNIIATFSSITGETFLAFYFK